MSTDRVVLAMAAHETHGADRTALFQAVAGSLGPSGRVVVVEHLRDAANMAAFGPGAWHFSTRDAWLDVAAAAGLGLANEAQLNPWVRGFVFEPMRTS